jgi:hypothetical protein
MTLQFMADATNVVLVRGNGLGKTMFASNLGYQAVLAGHTVLFVRPGSCWETSPHRTATRRCAGGYVTTQHRTSFSSTRGNLSYSNRHADLLFELVSHRYQQKSTVVTNKAFAAWGDVFPNAACVVSLVDRPMHRAEVVRIEGESYRAKGAQERLAVRARQRARPSPAGASRDHPPRRTGAAADALDARAGAGSLQVHTLRQQPWSMYGSAVQ